MANVRKRKRRSRGAESKGLVGTVALCIYNRPGVSTPGQPSISFLFNYYTFIGDTRRWDSRSLKDGVCAHKPSMIRHYEGQTQIK